MSLLFIQGFNMSACSPERRYGTSFYTFMSGSGHLTHLPLRLLHVCEHSQKRGFEICLRADLSSAQLVP